MADWIINDVDGNYHNTVVADNAEKALYGAPEGATATEVVPEVEEVDDTPPPRTWTADDVRTGMTLAERVSWDNDSHNAIVTAKIEMSQPKELTETTAVLDLLVDSSVISEDTKTAILA